MNERIKELWERACTRYSVYETLKPQDERKIIPDIFSELIVRECLTFVEPMPGSGDIDDLALEAAREGIKQHFGVEE
jgi:hypothetical protein